MSYEVTTEADGTLEIRVRVKPREGAGMLELEQQLQDGLNEAGAAASGELLSRFDTDGSPLVVGSSKLTSKGRHNKLYQSPYGPVEVSRHVYQGSGGGATYCPLERAARIIGTATPKFAKMLSSKYAEGNSYAVCRDLLGNHGRKVSRCFVQDTSEAVAQVALSKGRSWAYHEPELPHGVHIISVGLDGTCIRFDEGEENYRQVMVGTVALLDIEGERMHTIYVAAEPQYGKERFLQMLDREIELVKERYPWAVCAGVADGAKDNWPWLEERTDSQVLDFYHAAEYVSEAAPGACPAGEDPGGWTAASLHALKHDDGAAATLLSQMSSALGRPRLPAAEKKALQKAVSYFENNIERMDYPATRAANLPIGSGITEAACKEIVKARMCASGMKWKSDGSRNVLTLRTLLHSTGRWEQLWHRIGRYGV